MRVALSDTLARMWSHGLVHTATITGLVHSLIAEAVGTRTTHVQYLPDGGAVLLFDSPLAALSVALEIYRAVQEFNADMTDQVEWHIRLAGIAVIHMADNYVIGPALFGPAVQIAANVSWAAVTGTLGGRVDVSAPAVWTEPAKTKANVHSSRSTDSGGLSRSSSISDLAVAGGTPTPEAAHGNEGKAQGPVLVDKEVLADAAVVEAMAEGGPLAAVTSSSRPGDQVAFGEFGVAVVVTGRLAKDERYVTRKWMTDYESAGLAPAFVRQALTRINMTPAKLSTVDMKLRYEFSKFRTIVTCTVPVNCTLSAADAEQMRATRLAAEPIFTRLMEGNNGAVTPHSLTACFNEPGDALHAAHELALLLNAANVDHSGIAVHSGEVIESEQIFFGEPVLVSLQLAALYHSSQSITVTTKAYDSVAATRLKTFRRRKMAVVSTHLGVREVDCFIIPLIS